MNRKIQRWFIAEVFFHDKIFSWLLLLFVAAQAFFIYKGVETIPFFHWGMYSAKQPPPQKQYEVIEIAINDSLVDLESMKGLPKGYLQSILSNYATLKQDEFNDPIQKVIEHRFQNIPWLLSYAKTHLANSPRSELEFKSWLCNYLQLYSDRVIHDIAVLNCQYTWRDDRFILIQTIPIDSCTCNP